MTINTDTPVLTAEMAKAWVNCDEFAALNPPDDLMASMDAIASGAHVVVTAAEWELLREMALQRTAAVVVHRGQALAASEPVAAAFDCVTEQRDELLAALEPIRAYFHSANSIPVERATIKASDWALVEAAIAECQP